MKHFAALLLALLLTACASAPVAAPPELLRDDLYPGPHAVLGAAEIFAASDEMKRYLDQHIADPLRHRGLSKGLLAALYDRRQLQLEYDAERTRTAAEAFEARAGNCLSLVIMTASLARHLGLQVSFNSVLTEDTWTRQHDTYFASSHVNITLGPRPLDSADRGLHPSLTIDFLPPADLRGLRMRPIGESTVAAMYMNNRAAESLAAGELHAAYGWARAAITHEPRYLSAYNTLGVVYLRGGHADAAERALAHVLQQAPRSTVAMANLVRVYRAQGRADDAAAMAQRLARLDPEPPYHYHDLGQAALQRGDAAAAREWFRKELARAPYQHEFHFALAQAEARLGNLDAAREQLTLALGSSATRAHQQRYAAKLDHLQHIHQQHLHPRHTGAQ